MTKYLISFPSSAMAHLSPAELEAASVASRAVVQEAKDAGVWVFGGAINEGIAAALVQGDGTVVGDTYPESVKLSGGFTLLNVPSREAAFEWAAKIAVACDCAQEVREFHDDPDS